MIYKNCVGVQSKFQNDRSILSRNYIHVRQIKLFKYTNRKFELNSQTHDMKNPNFVIINKNLKSNMERTGRIC